MGGQEIVAHGRGAGMRAGWARQGGVRVGVTGFNKHRASL